MKLDEGYVQVYTGDGKGKTTASIGLCVRALGRGLKVCIVRFLKGGDEEGECALLRENFDNVTVISTGTGGFITGGASDEDISEANRGLSEAKKAIYSLCYDLIILEEVNCAISLNLIDVNDMLDIIKNKPQNVELVLTGRDAKKEVIAAADLVTEMKPIKHYFDKGVGARIGIES
jgi:cob(I)alamin adenosyltransferase